MAGTNYLNPYDKPEHHSCFTNKPSNLLKDTLLGTGFKPRFKPRPNVETFPSVTVRL